MDELLAQAKKDPVCSYMGDKLVELEDKGDFYEEEGEGTLIFVWLYYTFSYIL